MKIKNYLLRLMVGIVAFLFGFGLFSIWQYFQNGIEKPEQKNITAGKVETNLENIQQQYTAFTVFPKKELSVSTETETIQISEKTKGAKFDPEGFYYIAEENPPKEFRDFLYFEIANKDYNTEVENDFGKPIPPEGLVYIWNENSEDEVKVYNFNKISIGGGQIQFKTEQIKGISYEFTGHFLTEKNLIDASQEFYEIAANEGKTLKLLEGKLIKKRKGKNVSEIKVEFSWDLGGC